MARSAVQVGASKLQGVENREKHYIGLHRVFDISS